MTEEEELRTEIYKVMNENADDSQVWNHLDEVYPGIYIGDGHAAKDIDTLQRLGITHVLNTAYVKSRTHFFEYGTVNTDHDWYKVRNYSCEFLGVEAIDYPRFNLSQFFEEAANFIDGALSSNGKVLVHCYVGMSRSATLVIAYLMLKKKMAVKDIISLLRKKRPIYPNQGFVEQLIQLQLKLNQTGVNKKNEIPI